MLGFGEIWEMSVSKLAKSGCFLRLYRILMGFDLVLGSIFVLLCLRLLNVIGTRVIIGYCC